MIILFSSWYISNRVPVSKTLNISSLIKPLVDSISKFTLFTQFCKVPTINWRKQMSRSPCFCQNGYDKCPDCKGTGSQWLCEGKLLPFKLFNTPGQKKVTCSTCFGMGKTLCNICNGRGYTEHPYPPSLRSDDLNGSTKRKCFVCHGLGKVTCPSCHGSKYIILIDGHVAGSAQSFERNASPCFTCMSSAMVDCPVCQGTGYKY